MRNYDSLLRLNKYMTIAANNTVTCPRCARNTELVRAGRTSSGVQRYKCRACGSVRAYSPRRRTRYASGWHTQAAELRREGKSFREIGRILGINHQTAANWIAQSEAAAA